MPIRTRFGRWSTKRWNPLRKRSGRRLAERDVRELLLRDVARRLDACRNDIVATADEETHLGADRLESELKRTTDQLRFFAGMVADGSWVDARIDLGPPDLRRLLVLLGPVVVFGASNFPLAFSTPGGDTAFRPGRRIPGSRQGTSSASPDQ
ncbi:MAG TPA: hypothetical protein VMO52_00110 [Acidimicrobiia bacterium]|nr:hypothetical protein [Acidimicrobiia bacterium]